jgi:hypothetical protein
MRGAPLDDDSEFTYTFSRSLQSPALRRRFQNQAGACPAGFRQDLRAKGHRTHFLVRIKEESHRAARRHFQSVKRAEGPKTTHNARFHIQNAGTVRASLLNAKRHARKRAASPDGIVMTQQQNRFQPPASAPEFCCHSGPGVWVAMHGDFPPNLPQFTRKKCRRFIYAKPGITGRFDLNSLAQTFQHLIKLSFTVENQWPRIQVLLLFNFRQVAENFFQAVTQSGRNTGILPLAEFTWSQGEGLNIRMPSCGSFATTCYNEILSLENRGHSRNEGLMPNKVSLSMVIHSHQPIGNFDQVINEAFQKSYKPFIDVLERHPRIRLSLHYSGVLLEWLEERRPEFVQRLRELTQKGQVEHIGGGFFEPILAGIPHAEKVAQIQQQSDFLRERFGQTPRGAWITERVWQQDLIPPLVEAGVEYTVLDDTHFLAAGLDPGELHQAYLTEEAGLPLKLIPSLQSLRYTIPFRDPQETLAILREGLHKAPSLFAVGDDCEKFGVWPGTFDHCYTHGWLDRFFHALEEASDWLEVITLSDYLERQKPTRRVYLPTACYAEMMTWALPPAASTALEECFHQSRQMPDGQRFLRFLRGGQWLNFLSKYPESNQNHKLMLRACQRWHQAARVVAPGTSESKLLNKAYGHLLASQCNDAYWHGIFGGLYAPHLRSAILHQLIRAESILDRVEGSNSGPRIEVKDFDVDGQEEVLMEHLAFGLVIRPGDGGSVSSLRFKPRSIELINSLARRPEAYHRLVEQHAGEHGVSGGAPASIHNLIRNKESNLAELLRYDRYARHAFRAYLFPRGKNWQDFDNLSLDECTGLARDPWQLMQWIKVPTRFELQYAGAAWLNQRELNLCARKIFETSAQDSTWRTQCTLSLSSHSSEPARCALGMEMVINLLAPDSPDRYFQAGDSRHPLGFQGEIPGSHLSLVDEWTGLEINLDAPSTRCWWIAPIETISQSESGFERVYQGSRLMPVWDLELNSASEIACVLRMEIREQKGSVNSSDE